MLCRRFSSAVSNCWVDVFTDSQVLLKAWHRQSTKSQSLIATLKHLFGIISASNILLNLFQIPSKLIVAKLPSRTFFARLKTFSACLGATSKCFWWTFGSLC